MSQEIEIEFKNMLTEKEYQQLINHFHHYPNKQMQQKNHYFETNDFQLKKSQAALRIREKEHKYTLTLKQPNPNGAGLLETHHSLTEEEMNAWLHGNIISKPQVTQALTQLNIDIFSLQYGGMLMTDRSEYIFEQETIILDKSYYNNQIDYELELEATEENTGLETFQRLLSEHQIPKRKTMNKIERFYTTLEWD